MASFEKRGKNYRAIVSVMQGGVRKKVSKSFETKKEAKEWATLMESDKIQGKNLVASNMLFSDYFEFWMNTYKKKDIRESTFVGYKMNLININKLFPNVKMSELTYHILQTKFDEFGEDHAQITVTMFASHVKSCLRDALYDKYILDDFFSRLKPHGEKPEKPVNALSVTNFEKLQNYLYDKGELLGSELAILIALETGMRMGEILALTDADISIAFQNIHINKSYSRIVHEVTKPKNKHSYRDIKVTKRLIDTIIKNKKKDTICGILNGSVTKRLEYLIDELNLNRITPHGLRHSHASYLLYKGVSINYVSSRLGHADTAITQRVYAHMLKEEQLNETAKTLDILDNTLMSPNVPKSISNH